MQKRVNQRFSRFPLGNRKRGVSTIVATVLIILIVVAAIAIIWMVILPLLGVNLGGSGGELSIITSEGYTVYDPTTGLASVQIKRGDDDSELKNIEVVKDNSRKTQGLNSLQPLHYTTKGDNLQFFTAEGKVPSGCFAQLMTELNGDDIIASVFLSRTGLRGCIDSNIPFPEDNRLPRRRQKGKLVESTRKPKGRCLRPP